MKIPAFDPRPQNEPLLDEIKAAMNAVLDSGQFVGGPVLERFERNFAEALGAPFAVGVSSGTDALLLALQLAGVEAGDAVLTTPFTFFATAGVISRLGARPLFVDVRDDTLDLDPEAADRVLGRERVKALLPVHLFGRMGPVERWAQLAESADAVLVEDVAQATLARRGGRAAGTFGRFGAFSFYPTKNLGGFGDGGLVLCRNEEDADRLRAGRNHGMRRTYFHDFVGGNFRMDALQAAGLDVKLPHVGRWNDERRRLASLYDAAFAAQELGDRVRVPAAWKDEEHVFHQYVVRVDERDRLREHLAELGVGTAVYYPVPLHLQACFSPLGHRGGDFPVAERAAREVLALPMYPGLGEVEVERVVEAIAAFDWSRSRARR